MPASVLTTTQFLPYVAPFSTDFNGAVPNVDSDAVNPEDTLKLPWASNPATSWMDYRCWVEVSLDPGMVLHKKLPQSDPDADDLGSVDCQSPVLDEAQGGVALGGSGVSDVVQRMATSTYRFTLRGYGLRAGFQIPIPKLVSVGGVTPVPGAPQRAFNMIVDNRCGVPIFYAQWSLPYFVSGLSGASPSTGQAPVPFNPALHTRPDVQLPAEIWAPRAPLDMHATSG